jgi:hypothetical protein
VGAQGHVPLGRPAGPFWPGRGGKGPPVSFGPALKVGGDVPPVSCAGAGCVFRSPVDEVWGGSLPMLDKACGITAA